jgi:dTDP-4-dehydrorhamnose 3,5-epimerase-like enzyme
MSETPRVIQIKGITESRGNLNFIQNDDSMPFAIQRVYWLTAIPERQHRGGHAHKTSKQLIVCLEGKVTIKLESLEGDLLIFELSEPGMAVYIPPMWWGTMFFEQQAKLVGFASDLFSEEDYIRNKSNFK